MKTKEIRIKTDRELAALLPQMKEKLRDLKFKVSSDQVKNHRELRKTKKTIAQIQTIINERQKRKNKK